jgi:hypothetical protein
MNQRLLFLVLVVMGLSLFACGGEESHTEAAPHPSAVLLEPESVEEPAPREPTNEPPTLPPTAVPTLAVEVESAAAEAAAEAVMVPDLVWLPFGSGSYGNPVLTVQQGEIVYEEEPDAIEAYFDYADGRIAYGAEFWYAAANGLDAVTDLWVYDYATSESEQW